MKRKKLKLAKLLVIETSSEVKVTDVNENETNEKFKESSITDPLPIPGIPTKKRI